jgi:hypothetical protein
MRFSSFLSISSTSIISTGAGQKGPSIITPFLNSSWGNSSLVKIDFSKKI